MSLTEFDLIKRYFEVEPPRQAINQLGIGDDCALLQVPSGCQVALTCDTMVENVHFFSGADPESLGHKLLAVNLSDLAAMGAEPFAATLALTLPRIDESWLTAFCRGFFSLAKLHKVDLIGGDTTSGPLTLTVQAFGIIQQGAALLRSNAEPGDGIFISGEIGNAGLGLKILKGYTCSDATSMLNCLDKPQPRIAQGLALRHKASACIDISDGLTADLNHILEASNVGASIYWEKLPLSPPVSAYIEESGDWLMPLTAGDDYELCFTAPTTMIDELPAGSICIGEITAESGLRLYRDGCLQSLTRKGYEHFA
jgi:thiamine-monophosphate kinase